MRHFPLVLGRCALLVNDLHQRTLEPTSPSYAPAAVGAVERLLPLLAFCRAHGVPTVFALIAPPNWRRTELRAQAPGEPPEVIAAQAVSPLARALGPEPGDFVFEKPPISGLWHDTPVDGYLRERGRDIVLVAGVTLQFGCDTTVRDAYNRGYQVAALRDCCAGRAMADEGWGPVAEDEVERVCFTIWARWFARVLTAAEALAELRAQAPEKE